MGELGDPVGKGDPCAIADGLYIMKWGVGSGELHWYAWGVIGVYTAGLACAGSVYWLCGTPDMSMLYMTYWLWTGVWVKWVGTIPACVGCGELQLLCLSVPVVAELNKRKILICNSGCLFVSVAGAIF